MSETAAVTPVAVKQGTVTAMEMLATKQDDKGLVTILGGRIFVDFAPTGVSKRNDNLVSLPLTLDQCKQLRIGQVVTVTVEGVVG